MSGNDDKNAKQAAEAGGSCGLKKDWAVISDQQRALRKRSRAGASWAKLLKPDGTSCQLKAEPWPRLRRHKALPTVSCASAASRADACILCACDE